MDLPHFEVLMGPEKYSLTYNTILEIPNSLKRRKATFWLHLDLLSNYFLGIWIDIKIKQITLCSKWLWLYSINSFSLRQGSQNIAIHSNPLWCFLKLCIVPFRSSPPHVWWEGSDLQSAVRKCSMRTTVLNTKPSLHMRSRSCSLLMVLLILQPSRYSLLSVNFCPI